MSDDRQGVWSLERDLSQMTQALLLLVLIAYLRNEIHPEFPERFVTATFFARLLLSAI